MDRGDGAYHALVATFHGRRTLDVRWRVDNLQRMRGLLQDSQYSQEVLAEIRRAEEWLQKHGRLRRGREHLLAGPVLLITDAHAIVSGEIYSRVIENLRQGCCIFVCIVECSRGDTAQLRHDATHAMAKMRGAIDKGAIEIAFGRHTAAQLLSKKWHSIYLVGMAPNENAFKSATLRAAKRTEVPVVCARDDTTIQATL